MRQKGISKYKKNLMFSCIANSSTTRISFIHGDRRKKKTQDHNQIIKRANTPVPFSRAKPQT